MSEEKNYKEEKVISLESSRLHIKTLQAGDITDEYISGLNDVEVNQYVEVRFQEQSRASVEEFVINNFNSIECLLMGIYRKDNNRFLGTIRLSNISFASAEVNLGICIFDKQSWGYGFGLEALNRLGEYVFSEMRLQRINVGVYRENASSVAMFKKAGYEIVSEIVDKYMLNDQYTDVLMMRKVNSIKNISD